MSRVRESSSEHITRIERRTRFPQQRHELLLKTPFPMMFGLMGNVIGHNLLLRLAHAERSVSFLPFESHSALM